MVRLRVVSLGVLIGLLPRLATADQVRVDDEQPRVRLVYDGNAELQQAEPPAGLWTSVCHAPCEAPVNPRVLYRVRGPLIFPSEPFWVRGETRETVVDIDPAHKILYWSGATLAVLGILSTVVGGAMYLAHTSSTGQSGDSRTRDRYAIITLVGPTMFVVGAVLWGQNRHTILGVHE